MSNPFDVVCLSEGGELAARLDESARRVIDVRESDRALEALERTSVDCLVCEHAPEFDGVAMVSRVRDRGSDLPVVLYADSPAPETVARATRLENTEFVCPAALDGETLGDRVRAAVARSDSDRAGALDTLDVRPLERYRTIVETVPVGVFVIDETGVIVDHNDRAPAMLGYDESLSGDPFLRLVDDGVFEYAVIEEYVDGVREMLSSSTDAEQVVIETTTTVDGEERFVEASLALLPYDDEFRGSVGVFRDATKRRRSERELREERAFIESVIDSLHDTFYVINPDGTFRRWNDRLTAVTGYDDDDIASMNALELIHEDDREEIASAIASVFAEGDVEVEETTVVTKGGRTIPYRLNGAPIKDDSGEVVGLAGIGRDVSAEKERERRIEVLHRVLRHNLRNDVTLLLSHGEELADRLSDPELVSMAEDVRDVANELGSLSDKVKRIEAVLERDDVPAIPYEPAPVVESLVDSFRRRHPRVSFECDVEPVTAIADDRLRTALSNVLENAVEHDDADRPRVRVCLKPEPDGEWVRLAVTDDGPGIGDQERAVVLGDREITQLEHASGLGLWLVTWIVQAFDGRVDIDADDSGTTVTMRFRRV